MAARYKKLHDKILDGVRCCVDSKLDDGTEAGAVTKQLVAAMGGTVEGSLGVGQTHFVFWNGNVNHLRAAPFLGITVVSPLWVMQCAEAGRRVPETDFLVEEGKVAAAAAAPSAAEECSAPQQDSRESRRSSRRSSNGSATVVTASELEPATKRNAEPATDLCRRLSERQRGVKAGESETLNSSNNNNNNNNNNNSNSSNSNSNSSSSSSSSSSTSTSTSSSSTSNSTTTSSNSNSNSNSSSNNNKNHHTLGGNVEGAPTHTTARQRGAGGSKRKGSAPAARAASGVSIVLSNHRGAGSGTSAGAADSEAESDADRGSGRGRRDPARITDVAAAAPTSPARGNRTASPSPPQSPSMPTSAGAGAAAAAAAAPSTPGSPRHIPLSRADERVLGELLQQQVEEQLRILQPRKRKGRAAAAVEAAVDPAVSGAGNGAGDAETVVIPRFALLSPSWLARLSANRREQWELEVAEGLHDHRLHRTSSRGVSEALESASDVSVDSTVSGSLSLPVHAGCLDVLAAAADDFLNSQKIAETDEAAAGTIFRRRSERISDFYPSQPDDSFDKPLPKTASSASVAASRAKRSGSLQKAAGDQQPAAGDAPRRNPARSASSASSAGEVATAAGSKAEIEAPSGQPTALSSQKAKNKGERGQAAHDGDHNYEAEDQAECAEAQKPVLSTCPRQVRIVLTGFDGDTAGTEARLMASDIVRDLEAAVGARNRACAGGTRRARRQAATAVASPMADLDAEAAWRFAEGGLADGSFVRSLSTLALPTSAESAAETIAEHVTHVVVPASCTRRTLPMLVAWAAGVPVVTTDWLFRSVERGHWGVGHPWNAGAEERHSRQQRTHGLDGSDVYSCLLPRCCSTNAQNRQLRSSTASRLLEGEGRGCFLVGAAHGSEFSRTLVANLLAAAGAKVVSKGTPDWWKPVTTVYVGSADDGQLWLDGLVGVKAYYETLLEQPPGAVLAGRSKPAAADKDHVWITRCTKAGGKSAKSAGAAVTHLDQCRERLQGLQGTIDQCRERLQVGKAGRRQDKGGARGSTLLGGLYFGGVVASGKAEQLLIGSIIGHCTGTSASQAAEPLKVSRSALRTEITAMTHILGLAGAGRVLSCRHLFDSLEAHCVLPGSTYAVKPTLVGLHETGPSSSSTLVEMEAAVEAVPVVAARTSKPSKRQRSSSPPAQAQAVLGLDDGGHVERGRLRRRRISSVSTIQGRFSHGDLELGSDSDSGMQLGGSDSDGEDDVSAAVRGRPYTNQATPAADNGKRTASRRSSSGSVSFAAAESPVPGGRGRLRRRSDMIQAGSSSADTTTVVASSAPASPEADSTAVLFHTLGSAAGSSSSRSSTKKGPARPAASPSPATAVGVRGGQRRTGKSSLPLPQLALEPSSASAAPKHAKESSASAAGGADGGDGGGSKGHRGSSRLAVASTRIVFADQCSPEW